LSVVRTLCFVARWELGAVAGDREQTPATLTADDVKPQLKSVALSRSVHVTPMLYSVDHNGLWFFVDLVDDPVVTASGRMETFELPKQWFAEAVWILGYRAQDRR
jgi:hypothetical protein